VCPHPLRPLLRRLKCVFFASVVRLLHQSVRLFLVPAVLKLGQYWYTELCTYSATPTNLRHDRGSIWCIIRTSYSDLLERTIKVGSLKGRDARYVFTALTRISISKLYSMRDTRIHQTREITDVTDSQMQPRFARTPNNESTSLTSLRPASYLITVKPISITTSSQVA